MSAASRPTWQDRGSRKAAAVCVWALLLAAPAGAAGAPMVVGEDDPDPDAQTAPVRYPAVEDLFEPGVAARHAAVNRPVLARRRPWGSARSVGRLRMLTEDRTTEIVMVLARTTGSDGRTWLQIRLPVRPNGTTGWVPRDAVGQLQRVDTWLQVDAARTRLTLVRRGAPVFTARVGVGRAKWPTPRGEFYVRNVLSGRKLGRIYGALAFGTSARSDVLTDWPGGAVVGIHGTNEPRLIPGRISHGCVRLRNADILRLARLMPVGTPVTIT